MILITGAARSGTSLTASILQANGAFLGYIKDVNNLYEHQPIRQNFLKPLIKSFGGDPLGQKKFPQGHVGELLAGRTDFGIKKAFDPYFGSHKNAAYKDAKLTLIWDVFDAELDDIKWIIVRRDRDEIIDSCMRTHFMKAHDTPEGWDIWLQFHEAELGRLKRKTRHSFLEVWPKEFISDIDAAKEMTDFCGLDFDRLKSNGLIDNTRFQRA